VNRERAGGGRFYGFAPTSPGGGDAGAGGGGGVSIYIYQGIYKHFKIIFLHDEPRK
jgi:hypothetical protein